MAIQKEIWIQDIQEQLFAGAEFITNSTSHDAFVENKTVHLPQAGTIPAITKDRSSFPAAISVRTDTSENYDLGEYSTDPIKLGNVEEIQASYDKRTSIMAQQMASINNRLGLEAAYQWAGAGLLSAGGQIIRTSGTDSALALPPSATGDRKPITIKDIAAAAAKLDIDQVPQEGRYLLMPAAMYWELMGNETNLLNSLFMGNGGAALPTGVVNKILGFNIIIRSTTVIYDAETTPVKKAVGAAAAATDNYACIGWQSSCVAKALGEVKVFSVENDPSYYGSIFSAAVMFAAKAIRTDGKGIVTIVQTT